MEGGLGEIKASKIERVRENNRDQKDWGGFMKRDTRILHTVHSIGKIGRKRKIF